MPASNRAGWVELSPRFISMRWVSLTLDASLQLAVERTVEIQMPELRNCFSDDFDHLRLRPLVPHSNGIDSRPRSGKATGWQWLRLRNSNRVVARVVHCLIRIEQLLMILLACRVGRREIAGPALR